MAKYEIRDRVISLNTVVGEPKIIEIPDDEAVMGIVHGTSSNRVIVFTIKKVEE